MTDSWEEDLDATEALTDSWEGDLVEDTCPAGFVLILPGEFWMGSPDDEPGRYENEEPMLPVQIGRGYCLKATQVTQGEWEELMGNNPSWFKECGLQCPVENVNWWEAVAYCNALSRREGLEECYALEGWDGSGCGGKRPGEDMECSGVRFVGLGCVGYRLPTEAEWEYAARAGTTGGTYNGTSQSWHCEAPNPVLDSIAWFCGNSARTTHPVAQKRPNEWGLYDMLGNVWEWAQDWYHENYEGAPTAGWLRVGRGGSWDGFAGVVRAANRFRGDPGYRIDSMGLRPARSGP